MHSRPSSTNRRNAIVCRGGPASKNENDSLGGIRFSVAHHFLSELIATGILNSRPIGPLGLDCWSKCCSCITCHVSVSEVRTSAISPRLSRDPSRLSAIYSLGQLWILHTTVCCAVFTNQTPSKKVKTTNVPSGENASALTTVASGSSICTVPICI
jgi:hypothetical protein